MGVLRLHRRGPARVVGLAVVLAFALAGPAARAAPRRYVLEPAASRIEIHVGKTGLFGFAGHEHQVVAGSFHGTATFDPQRVTDTALDLTVDAGALRVTGEGEPAGDAPQVQAAMLGPSCLDAARFPTIHFVSNVVGDGGAHGATGRDLMVRGRLTLHGVTGPLTVRVSVDLVGDRLEATGRATLRQTDFGITPISKAGVVKVKDEVSIVFRIQGIAVAPGG